MKAKEVAIMKLMESKNAEKKRMNRRGLRWRKMEQS